MVISVDIHFSIQSFLMSDTIVKKLKTLYPNWLLIEILDSFLDLKKGKIYISRNIEF